MVLSATEPRSIAIAVALIVGLPLLLALLWRARHSRYPALLYTCAGALALLHAVWIVGLLTSLHFSSGFATLILLTFPWSFSVTTNMSMAGFDTLHDLLLNYARFVLGFGGLQCLLLTLFVWELRPAPRPRHAASRSSHRSRSAGP